jgi:uncharacterized protein (TIGR00730 family)
MEVLKAYKNLGFLNSPQARAIRILCEYEEPMQRFQEQNVNDTIVFFGSARAKPMDIVKDQIIEVENRLNETQDAELKEELHTKLKALAKAQRLSKYYEKTRELARRLTEWDINRDSDRNYYIATGGGPGMMEAANRGAAEVSGGKSVGLGISLPFEEGVNEYVTPELAFEFHYFFTRKYWFLYLCKAMVICPGGFGTLDELFETLTLRQTKKIKKNIPTVLFGTEYWDNVLNVETMSEWGTISPDDIKLVLITDSIDEAYNYIVNGILESE